MIRVIDNFLDQEVAERLHREAVQRSSSGERLFKGYESIDFLADEVVQMVLPRIDILNTYRLCRSWGFIYDNGVPGVPPHADPADLNLNLWITPDSCINDPEKNGLKIWRIRPPKEWSFLSYNANPKKVMDYIGNRDPEIVSYRFNRAVLFDSQYFHATNGVSTHPGANNRRVSFTFLFERVA